MSPVLILCTCFAIAPGPGVLIGRITDPEGQPIANAHVDIWTAKPKVGIGTTCPSCYRDCAKSTKSGSDGRFEIEGLDPGFLFTLTVTSPGRRALVTKYLDPAEKEHDLELTVIPSGLPDDQVLRGRVLDEHGSPVAGALVTPTGAKTSRKRWWGPVSGVDAASVTDEAGRFIITCNEPKLGLDLEVEAPGFAKKPAALFGLDGKQHDIRLQRGAHVTGRISADGKPRGGRAIGIVQRERSMDRFVGEETISTNSNGEFQFVNLQPNESYILYSLCSAGDDDTVLKTIFVDTGANNSTVNVGELELLKGFTLGGRVVIPKGAQLPPTAKLRISRDPAWDWDEVKVGEEGRFSIRGLPSEVLTVTVTAPGFMLDSNRLRFQTTGTNQFAFRLREDRNDVLIWLIPEEKP